MREGRRFKHLARDYSGKEIPLVDFETMKEPDLELWRDHLIDSFAKNSAYKRPFTFLKKDGSRLPKLSKLEMGSKASTGAQKPKGTQRKGKKQAVAKTSSQRKRGSTRKGQSKSKATISDSDFESHLNKEKKQAAVKRSSPRKQGSVSDSDFEHTDQSSTNPPPKKRITRRTSTVLATAAETLKADSDGSGKVAANKDTAKDAAEPAHVAVAMIQNGTSIDTPSKSRKARALPGSQPGQLLAAERRIVQMLASSFYLQTRAMVGGTLPNEWSSVNFSPSKVRLQFMTLLNYSLHSFRQKQSCLINWLIPKCFPTSSNLQDRFCPHCLKTNPFHIHHFLRWLPLYRYMTPHSNDVP